MTALQVEQNERNVDRVATQLRFYMNRETCADVAIQCRLGARVYCIHIRISVYSRLCGRVCNVLSVWFTVRKLPSEGRRSAGLAESREYKAYEQNIRELNAF